jgi:hypothetical protein
MDATELSEKIRGLADTELSERTRAQSEEINRGAPIPAVRASDMKQLWDAMRRIKADISLKSNAQIGMGALAAYGVEAAVNRPEEYSLMSTRFQLLSFLVERAVLNDYKHGEELDERVFRAAATMPCNIHDLGETILPLALAQSPPEIVAKTKEEMLARGYDPEKPNLDGKFLNWLRENC